MKTQTVINDGISDSDSPLEILAFGVDLGFVVKRSEFGHQVGGVLRGVHRQRLRNDEQGTGKLCNRQLLP